MHKIFKDVIIKKAFLILLKNTCFDILIKKKQNPNLVCNFESNTFEPS
jgi:hypothetical protein